MVFGETFDWRYLEPLISYLRIFPQVRHHDLYQQHKDADAIRGDEPDIASVGRDYR